MRKKSFKVGNLIKHNGIVAHPVFGEGIVVASRWDGGEVQIKFRSGLCLWLPTRWLRPIAGKPGQLDQVSSKRLLEAFRLGVVPHQDIEQFTFGRGYEISALNRAMKDMKQGQGTVFMVEGAYGSGKTHLLEYTRHMALKRGFVTSYCELSTQETPLYRPKRIYRELVYSLRFIVDNCEYHYRDLLRMAAKIRIEDHCFYTPVLKRLRDIEEGDLMSEVFWQWIEGESTKNYAVDPNAPFRVRGAQKIPALYDFSTAGDFYTYIITGLSHIVRELGLPGVVIIIDETETITRIWNYIRYSRGLSFLEGLIRAAQNDDELKTIDNYLVHNKVRPTPYIYREPCILLVLAMTPIHGYRGVDSIMRLIREKMFLRKFSKPELEVIYDNLIEVFGCAYPHFALEAARRDTIFNAALKTGSGELREFIKFCVEAFDWLRLSQRPSPKP